MSKKVIKELYGAMFEIKTKKDGTKEAVLTEDKSKAVFILAPNDHRRCPHCSSDKCLENIVGESLVWP